MNYCLIKNTTIIIDGSTNPKEIMLANAKNSGYNETEVEILSEVEFLDRKNSEEKPTELPIFEQRLETTENTLLNLLMMVQK